MIGGRSRAAENACSGAALVRPVIAILHQKIGHPARTECQRSERSEDRLSSCGRRLTVNGSLHLSYVQFTFPVSLAIVEGTTRHK